MKTTAVLGRRESQELEFKAAGILEECRSDPGKVAREVVGMLNADGGEIWIGVREDNGVAVEYQEIDRADEERSRLVDVLIDVIEPAPGPREVALTVEAMDGRKLIRIDVSSRPSGRPYAVRKGQTRLYVVRHDARLRPMTRDEIGKAFVASREAVDESGREKESVLAEMIRLRENALPAGGGDLWIRLVTLPKTPLDLQREDAREILMDPRRTSNREAGWNFVNPYDSPVSSHENGVRWLGTAIEGYASVAFSEHGTIKSRTWLEALRWRNEGQVFYPFALMEHVAAVLRLASTVYQALSEGAAPNRDAQVFLDAGLRGAEGWGLKPGSPDSIGYMRREPAPLNGDDVVLWDTPVEFRLGDVVETPDRCALRVVRRIYGLFGYTDRDLPPQFDQEKGMLLIPT